MGIVIPGVKLMIDRSFAMAVDLGQSTDPTAVSVIEHQVHNEVTWKGRETRLREEFHVRYLRRLPLGMSYVEQVNRIGDLYSRPPLNASCDLVIDETGVGRPVGDLFNAAKLNPIRVTITAGDNQTMRGTKRFHVAKSLLISMLDARLHTGELKIASDLPEAEALKEELRDFRRHISAAGRFSFEARTGKHDDLVLSCALALWAFVGRDRPPTAETGRWRVGAPIIITNNKEN
jgi:hypothetical protein